MTTSLDQPADGAAAAVHVERRSVSFDSSGTRCDAWHFVAAHDRLTRPSGRPCVVMAHGLAGTKDSGLQPFAEPLASAGLDVLAFDYRGFGASDGSPRQSVSMEGQLADYRAALAAAAGLPGVDGGRLVLWGVSLAGGHVLAAAADRDDVAAAVALTPLVDGLAAGRLALRSHSLGQLLRSTGAGVRSHVSLGVGRGPVMMPVVGPPGSVGALTRPGCEEEYLSIAGPSWRNEVDARVGLELGGYRPGRQASRIRCPLLVQVADFDRSAPPQAAMRAAFRARAEVRHYPGDHFDVYAGRPCHESVVSHQVAFLSRHLGG